MKSLKITPPKGYEIDRDRSTLDNIVFKPLPLNSWENFIKQNPYLLDTECLCSITPLKGISSNYSRTGLITCPGEYEEPLKAFIKLLTLRKAMIGNWTPDWTLEYQSKYCIINQYNKSVISVFRMTNTALSFPTEEMAQTFLTNFADLIEQALPLI